MSAKMIRNSAIILLAAICLIGLVFVNKQTSAAPQHARGEQAHNIAALPGYQVDVFARGNTSYWNPDSVDVAGNYVFVGFQNTTAKDGTDNKKSTIVQYDKSGNVLHTWSVPGHNDGLRYNSDTKLLWSTSNEDGNPNLETIDPATGTITNYAFPMPTPHGGGYDDVIFTGGKAFIAASNPTLNNAGINTAPAVDQIELKDGKAILTPVLAGNATATDLVSNTPTTLNVTDADSQTIDNQGNLVQDDQGDSQLIFLHNPGTAQQTVSRLNVGTQLDDTLWIPPTEGRMLVVDGKANTIYIVRHDGDYTPGTVYAEAPSDSGVAGFVGTLDLKTGTITPTLIGFISPTGLAFLPQ